jgi:hypothetical protein
MDSTLSAFTINPTSGVLTAMSGSPFTLSGSVLFCSVDVSGKFLYVAGAGISGFTISPTTGVLTAIPGSPFPAGINVVSMVTAKTKWVTVVVLAGGGLIRWLGFQIRYLGPRRRGEITLPN